MNIKFKRPKIAPSILDSDFSRLGEQVKIVEKTGVEILHIDVMDGHFVPNISIGPVVVKSVRRITELFLDVHLMIENPENYIDAFVNAGADNLTVHQEACDDLGIVIRRIKDHNIKAGVAIKPKTPVSSITNIIEEIDLLLIMSVEPGFGGQKFIPGTLSKLSQAQELVQSKNLKSVDIEVDGGISIKNIKEISDAGAEIFVVGSAIYGAQNPAAVIKQMQKKIEVE